MRSEAVALTKDTVTWRFDCNIGARSVQQFLRTFTPFLQHTTRGLNLATTTLEGRYYDDNGWESKSLTFRDVIGYDRLSELTVRLTTRKAEWGPGPLFVPPNGDPTVQVSHTDLAYALIAINWGQDAAPTAYRLLTAGQVACVKIEHIHAYEGLRSFFQSPLTAIFGNIATGRVLSQLDVDTLVVHLDWPIESKTMVVTITKKAAHFR